MVALPSRERSLRGGHSHQGRGGSPGQGVFSILAEGAGFEPANLSVNGFQDRRLRPLGHPSGIAQFLRPERAGRVSKLKFLVPRRRNLET